jgi:uncharacterized protein (TIRG00374 family)
LYELRILAVESPKTVPTGTFYLINMKKTKGFQFVLLLLLGCVLIYFSIQKINVTELIDTIKQAHFAIAVPVFAVSLAGYYFRSLRWKLLLDTMNIAVPTPVLFASLSIGYAVNIATPRLGEVARCLMLKKTRNVSLEQSGVSVVVERLIDIVSLGIVVLVASIVQVNESSLFIREQILTPIITKVSGASWQTLLLSVVVVCFVLFGIQKAFQRWKPAHTFIQRVMIALKNMLHLKHKVRFIVYTVLIWLCYFLMTYLWFHIFDETKNLGLAAAFIIMAVGSIGRSVPIQGGGMGAYHFLVSNAFVLFGIGLVTGNAMAFVIHGAQIIFTFVLGISCWIWILFNREPNEI